MEVTLLSLASEADALGMLVAVIDALLLVTKAELADTDEWGKEEDDGTEWFRDDDGGDEDDGTGVGVELVVSEFDELADWVELGDTTASDVVGG